MSPSTPVYILQGEIQCIFPRRHVSFYAHCREKQDIQTGKIFSILHISKFYSGLVNFNE